MTDRKKAAFVCSTYRQAGRDNTARFMGAMALVDQVLKQDFNGDIFLAVVDDSPEPHKFLQKMAQERPEQFLYLHVPARNGISSELRSKFSQAIGMIPTDDDLANNPFWKKRIEQMVGWGKIVPFEDHFAARISIKDHVFLDRPTIGTKKNVGVMAICETFGEPDYIMFADDDDYRSGAYFTEVANALECYDFTRIHKYLTYVANGDKKEIWGVYDFPFPEDANGHFYPTEQMREEPILTSQIGENGKLVTMDGKYWFSRLAIAAWDPICNEGAVHNYRYDMWKRGLETFGASSPSNMGEDIILLREFTEHFGKSVRRGLVPFNDYSFVRTADGNNASFVMFNRDTVEGGVPQWAQTYISHLKAAHTANTSGKDVNTESLKIADRLLKTDEYNPSAVFACK
ncbi:MAG: hypothetical protein RBR86_03105 [Pseudobdellovibrionaceae bacterium]|jgi:hypothetical protein|nr:hypothetical protein [Pseudobdellovibrionaceae bacterium]